MQRGRSKAQRAYDGIKKSIADPLRDTKDKRGIDSPVKPPTKVRISLLPLFEERLIPTLSERSGLAVAVYTHSSPDLSTDMTSYKGQEGGKTGDKF